MDIERPDPVLLSRKSIWPSLVFVVIVIAVVLLLSGCADPNPHKGMKDSEGEVAGFFFGFWNGLTSLFSLIGSLLSSKITVYEVHNNGAWYNAGFLLGGFCFILWTQIYTEKEKKEAALNQSTTTEHKESHTNQRTIRAQKVPDTENWGGYIDV